MNAKKLTCKVASIGAWGSYFDSWEALQQLLSGSATPDIRNKGPKPTIIPPNERRRAPLPVRLAVESSWQATQAANISPETLTCVFVSGLGDTDLTDYMCKVLASEHKELSPTKFHNSVHNAPAGYWTISTKTMTAANSVAGFNHSVSLTLLEAMIQCESENVPIMMTFYDAPVTSILQPLLSNNEAFAFSIIIYPKSSDINGISISACVNSNEYKAWPTLHSTNSDICSLYEENPSAKILCLAELLTSKKDGAGISMPLSAATSLSFERN
ncbi:beta-ketoacyl synthase chain length factor [Alteromonas sp. 5E99-2]|uniref:beta-ketoacyl synthase chain length factor n=1 Tax=Alteromonas sp. 5E99-2 TaxID=2817683 RepID=UPI001A984EC6|nr:beta-ketoacyl synthase chain length factor [Alteromonas sp. 5E99-2]MBO1256762.1 beta-ketoacyl synthase chain length factor [Alteromonas sp. 5E99-2]